MGTYSARRFWWHDFTSSSPDIAGLMAFDVLPLRYEGFRRRVIVRTEAGAAPRTPTTGQPDPFGAQHMNEGVPDGRVAATHGSGEQGRTNR